MKVVGLGGHKLPDIKHWVLQQNDDGKNGILNIYVHMYNTTG